MVSYSSTVLLVISVEIYNLLSSIFLALPITYKIAVKNDWGLKNLEIIITLGSSIGLFLNSSSWATLYSRFNNHEVRPLLEGKAKFYQTVGTLLKYIASIILSILSLIVNKP